MISLPMHCAAPPPPQKKNPAPWCGRHPSQALTSAGWGALIKVAAVISFSDGTVSLSLCLSICFSHGS